MGGSPEVGEEEHLCRRAEQQGRHVHRRPDPGEQCAEADRAAEEEHAEERLHVSESVARSRARRSKWWRSVTASAPYATVRSAHHASGTSTRRRRARRAGRPACPRSGRAPRRRARSTPGGARAGSSIPVIIQTGYSSALREGALRPVEDERRGQERGRASRSTRTAAGIEAANEQRVDDVERDTEEQPSPERVSSRSSRHRCRDRDGDRREHERSAASALRRATRARRTSAAAGSRRRRSISRRRPDAHHGGAEGGVEQGRRWVSRRNIRKARVA